ncbi:hypothetical protein PLESTF_000644100 [Pleodorina starrii]|nr:hypothetical protein PLESTF_000644100 [Pleodorina starrii]
MVFKTFLSCFKGAPNVQCADDCRLLSTPAIAAAGRHNSAQELESDPGKSDISYITTFATDGGLGIQVSGTPLRTAANWPVNTTLLPTTNQHQTTSCRVLQSSSQALQAASRDSLICAHVPAAITVFNRLREPIHQNPASALLHGSVAQPFGCLPPGARDNRDARLLERIFALQPDKLEIMWLEVMGPGGGRWKGIVRVPPQPPLPRPEPALVQDHDAAAADSTAASPTTPVQQQPWARLPGEPYSVSGSRIMTGESREGGGGGDTDEGGAHGDGCAGIRASRDARIAVGSPIGGLGGVAAAMPAAAPAWPNSASAGCSLYGTAPDPLRRTAADDVLAGRAASRLRLTEPLAKAVRNGDGSGRRRLSGRALQLSFSRASCCEAAVPRIAAVVKCTGRSGEPEQASRIASGSGAGPGGPSGVAVLRTGDRPHSSSGRCTAANGLSGCSTTTSDFCGLPTSTHSFKRHSLPDQGCAMRPCGATTCVTGRISPLLLGVTYRHPTNTSTSINTSPPPLPIHASPVHTSSWRNGGGNGAAAAAGGGSGAAQPALAAGSPLDCPLDFDLGEIPESVAPDTSYSLSRGWDSTLNPLATSTFGLTLGATMDGLPEAAMPLFALASAVASGGTAVAAGGGGGGGTSGSAGVAAAAALGPPRALDTAAATAAAAAAAAASTPIAIPSPGGGAAHRWRISRTRSASIGAAAGGSFSRVLTFASSLRNAPVATQLLADASRPGGGAGGGGSGLAASCKPLLASPPTAGGAAAGWEGLQRPECQQAAPIVRGPGRLLRPPQQLADGRQEASTQPATGRFSLQILPSNTAGAGPAGGADAAVTANAGDAVRGADTGVMWGSVAPTWLPTAQQPQPQQPAQAPVLAQQQGCGDGGGEGLPAGPAPCGQSGGSSPPVGPGPELPTVDWPVGLDSSSSSASSEGGCADDTVARAVDADAQRQSRQPQDRPQQDPEQQQQLSVRQPASLLQSSGSEGVPGGGTTPQGECWHEVWATRAVDPVTGEEVLVLAQHDISAKVVAERHLALVMEAEHRLLEQLFPKHILTHVTEEWIAEAERGAAGGAEAARSTAVAAALPTPVKSARWRPVIRDCNSLATWHPEVTLLFADIKGFTPMCKQVTPREVMTMLNQLFSRFDAMLDKFGVFKVETIGDCYFVAGGLIQEDEDGMAAVRDGDSRGDPLHAHKVFMFAKAMLAAAREVRMPSSGEPVQIRIGISSGPVVSGVVGTRMPRFCLFGDTVNTTSRMESTGQPGAIHASESAYALLKSEAWEATGGIEVKGKGLMQTYLWRPQHEEDGAEGAPRCLPASAEEAAKALMQAVGSARRASAAAATATGGSGDDIVGRRTLGMGPLA